MPADQPLPVVREHRAVLQVIVAARELELIECEGELEPVGGLLQDAQSLGDDFLADTIAWNHRDPI